MTINKKPKPEQAKDGGKVCFSYIRFSSRKQSKGDSESRQLEIAPAVAREKNWTLDESLNAVDLGLSAYKKFNLRDGGGLKAVIEAAESGKIPKGSVMIVEAIDRLFRLPVDDAYQIFRQILLTGLEIYTKRNDRHLTKEDLNNPFSIMMTISELFAANEFSEKLSERVGKAWKRKREALAGGKRLTKKIPGWIDVESWKPISGRVATVKKIFSLYDSGHGISAIVKLLNGTQVPTWGGKREGKTSDWNASYVSQLLRSRTVIGEFQAHVTKTAETGNYYKRIQSGLPIEDYYPVIISKELFYRVQSKLGDAKAKTKSDKIGNLFSGVAFCKCGAKMYLVNSGKKNGLYYTCWNKVKGLKCDSPAVHYEPIETNFTRIFECDPNQLIEPDGDDSATTKADSLRAQLAEREKKIQNITEAVLGGAATKALIAKQGELESEVEAIKRELEIAQSKTSSCKTDAQQFEYIAKHIGQLRTNKDIRRKVRGWILANLKRMEFDSKKGRLNVQMKSGYNWPLRFFETKLIPSRLVVKTTEF